LPGSWNRAAVIVLFGSAISELWAREMHVSGVSRETPLRCISSPKPAGFFDRNPALDVPAPEAEHCHG